MIPKAEHIATACWNNSEKDRVEILVFTVKSDTPLKPFTNLSIPVLLAALVFLMTPISFALTLKDIDAALPQRLGGLRTEPKGRIYDEQTIFDYIDGAAEVYRAYKMRACLSRNYGTQKNPTLILDIFDMGTSQEAYGVFTHDQDGEDLDIGQGALYRTGWLSFWKDRFFVSIYAGDDTKKARESAIALARSVASLISGQGLKPEILSRLPEKGLKPKSARYLHDHAMLNYHFYFSDENILKLGSETNAALAEYHRYGQNARLLLVLYPDEKEAAAALLNFYDHYLPEGKGADAVQIEDGTWSVASVEGILLGIVLESDHREMALELLEEALKTKE